MPRIYLSPSLQQNNPYVIGGSEEYYMNLVADAMEPYLLSSGIAFTRNDPEQTLSQVIAQSNAGDYDLHLALHSNAAGEANAGQVRGPTYTTTPTARKGNVPPTSSQKTSKTSTLIPAGSGADPYQLAGRSSPHPRPLGAGGDRLSRQCAGRGMDPG